MNVSTTIKVDLKVKGKVPGQVVLHYKFCIVKSL